MPEFKVRKGGSTFSAGDVGALLELARRGVIHAEDPIFLPIQGTWVRARLLKDLQPFLDFEPSAAPAAPRAFHVQVEQPGLSPEFPLEDGVIEHLEIRPPHTRPGSLLARLLEPEQRHEDLATPRETSGEHPAPVPANRAPVLRVTPEKGAEPEPRPPGPRDPARLEAPSRSSSPAIAPARLAERRAVEERIPKPDAWLPAPVPVEAWEPNPDFRLPEAPGPTTPSSRALSGPAFLPTATPAPAPSAPGVAGAFGEEGSSTHTRASKSPGPLLFPVGKGAERDRPEVMELPPGADGGAERARRETLPLEQRGGASSREVPGPSLFESHDDDSLWGSGPLVSPALLPLAAPVVQQDASHPDALAGMFDKKSARAPLAAAERPPEHELEMDFSVPPPEPKRRTEAPAERREDRPSLPRLPKGPGDTLGFGTELDGLAGLGKVTAGPGPGSRGLAPSVPPVMDGSASSGQGALPARVTPAPSPRPRPDRTLSEMQVSVVTDLPGARTARRGPGGDSSSKGSERVRTTTELEPAPAPAARLAPGAPPSFQDWVEKRTDSPEAGRAGEKLAAAGVISQPRKTTETRPRSVRWGLLVGVGVLGIVVVAIARFSLSSLSQQQFPSLAEEVSRQTSGLGPAGPEARPPATTVEAELMQEEARLRSAIRPQLAPLKSFDLAQDELFSELVNLKLSVRDVSLEPVDGNRSRSVRTSESDLTIRLRPGRLLLDEQVALAGLVVGKYVLQDRIRIRHLFVQLERRTESGGEPPLVRQLSGKDAASFYNQTMTLQQFRLAVVAGTRVP